MKTALCLHGYLKNAGGLNAFFESNQYLESKIFKKLDTAGVAPLNNIES